MDKIEHYRRIITKILTDYHQMMKLSDSDVESLLALDDQRDQYLWFRSGWEGKKHVQYIVIYLRIKNNKIWVEEDMTDLCVVDDLLEAGVPKSDIVLGFQPPSKRSLTEFAIA
ncbi:XisI protein [Phormidesmis sp. 146-33]